MTVESVARDIALWKYSETQIAEKIRRFGQSIRDEDVKSLRDAASTILDLNRTQTDKHVADVLMRRAELIESKKL